MLTPVSENANLLSDHEPLLLINVSILSLFGDLNDETILAVGLRNQVQRKIYLYLQLN